MAEETKTTVPVDLFGNPRLTPRQVMQQQLSALLQSVAARTAAADPRTRGVSMMGAAVGGLLRNVLINKGVLPKPPEVERAEKLEQFYEEWNRKLDENEISMADDPDAAIDFAVAVARKIPGLEDIGMKALLKKQELAAARRAAELEQAKLDKTRAETTKTEVETVQTAAEVEQMEEKLDLLRRQVANAEQRTQIMKRFADLKQSKTSVSEATAKIVERYLKRAEAAEKAGKPVPDFKPSERKALQELQKAGFIDRILLGGGVLGPSLTGGGGDDVIDLTAE